MGDLSGEKNRIPGVIKLVPFKWKNKKFWLENKMVGTIRGTASENMGCDLGQCNFSTLFSLLRRFRWIYFVVGCSPTTSNFIVL